MSWKRKSPLQSSLFAESSLSSYRISFPIHGEMSNSNGKWYSLISMKERILNTLWHWWSTHFLRSCRSVNWQGSAMMNQHTGSLRTALRNRNPMRWWLFIRILLRCPMYSMRGIIRWSPMRSILRIHGYCGAHPLRRSGLSSVRDMVFYIPERHREIDVDKAFRLPFFLRQHIRFTQGVV